MPQRIPEFFLRDVEELRTIYIDVDNRYEITLRMKLVILFCMIIRIIITAYSQNKIVEIELSKKN